MKIARFMEMLGRDIELLKIRESERHHRFELLVDSECVAEVDSKLSAKFWGNMQGLINYMKAEKCHAWEALNDAGETYCLISDGPDGADRGKVYRMKIAEFIKSLGEDSERLEIFESKKHRRFALIIDFVCVATVDSELSAKFWGNKQGLIEYMRAERCHVWKTSGELYYLGEFYYLISDGPDISWGHTFSWDDL